MPRINKKKRSGSRSASTSSSTSDEVSGGSKRRRTAASSHSGGGRHRGSRAEGGRDSAGDGRRNRGYNATRNRPRLRSVENSPTREQLSKKRRRTSSPDGMDPGQGQKSSIESSSRLIDMSNVGAVDSGDVHIWRYPGEGEHPLSRRNEFRGEQSSADFMQSFVSGGLTSNRRKQGRPISPMIRFTGDSEIDIQSVTNSATVTSIASTNGALLSQRWKMFGADRRSAVDERSGSSIHARSGDVDGGASKWATGATAAAALGSGSTLKQNFHSFPTNAGEQRYSSMYDRGPTSTYHRDQWSNQGGYGYRGGRYPIQAGNQRGLTRQRRDFARGRGTYVGQGAEQTMQQQQQGRVLRKAIVYRPGEQQSDKPVMNLFDPTKVPRSRNYFEHDDRERESLRSGVGRGPRRRQWRSSNEDAFEPRTYNGDERGSYQRPQRRYRDPLANVDTWKHDMYERQIANDELSGADAVEQPMDNKS